MHSRHTFLCLAALLASGCNSGTFAGNGSTSRASKTRAPAETPPASAGHDEKAPLEKPKPLDDGEDGVEEDGVDDGVDDADIAIDDVATDEGKLEEDGEQAARGVCRFSLLAKVVNVVGLGDDEPHGSFSGSATARVPKLPADAAELKVRVASAYEDDNSGALSVNGKSIFNHAGGDTSRNPLNVAVNADVSNLVGDDGTLALSGSVNDAHGNFALLWVTVDGSYTSTSCAKKAKP